MNFFQKLTGSFKIQEENNAKPKGNDKDSNGEEAQQKESEDALEQNTEMSEKLETDEILDNNEPDDQDTALPDADNEDEDIDGATEAAEEEEEQEDDEEPEEKNEEDLFGKGNDEFDIGSSPDALEEENELDEPEQKTYTIAELAKATIKKEGSHKRRFPSLRVSNEDANKKGELPTEESKTPEGQLAIDVYENQTEIVIKSTIAGVKPEDLDVGIEDNSVNIRGSRQNEEKIKTEDYFYQECYWGTFSRSIILPVEIDSEKATAVLKDGILTIRLPKIKKDKEKKIKVVS